MTSQNLETRSLLLDSAGEGRKISQDRLVDNFKLEECNFYH